MARNRTRAYRRNQKGKFRRKTNRIVEEWSASAPQCYDDETKKRLVIIHEKNRRKCNCPMCQNERYRDERAKHKLEDQPHDS